MFELEVSLFYNAAHPDINNEKVKKFKNYF